jgi:hypothetical protein
MSISPEHLRIIKCHIAKMYREISQPYVGKKFENHIYVLSMVDEIMMFNNALKAFVSTIGTDAYPEIDCPLFEDEDYSRPLRPRLHRRLPI